MPCAQRLKHLVILGVVWSVANTLRSRIMQVQRMSTTTSTTAKHDNITKTLSLEDAMNNINLSFVDDEETFSACLMWMDDMNRLAEWIAYHFQVLPLRNLIFLRDPKSITDPAPILDRWRPFMNITYWTKEEEFMDEATREEIAGMGERKSYIFMQKAFYWGCIHHLQKMEKKWTAVFDVDEFVVLNSEVVPDSQTKMRQPGIVMDVIKKARNKDESVGIRKKTNVEWFGSCILMDRLEYTSFESNRENVTKAVPDFLDPYRFQTLRYRHSSRKRIIGKTMLDVSKYNIQNYTMRKIHAHYVLERHCKFGKTYDLMRVNHYLGGHELYARPADKRFQKNSGGRAEQLIMKNGRHKNRLYRKFGDEARPWILGFVDQFGENMTSYLLEGSGFPYNETTAFPIFPANESSQIGW